jgi:hypothetical protein
MLPSSAVKEDRRLEAAHERTSEALAKHRWHWTLDESNPERVSLKEYARQVGRAFSSVKPMVNGYAAWKKANASEAFAEPGKPVTLNDHVQQARFGTERSEATEAVARATGKGFGGAAHPSMRSEVDEVLSTARERAERFGTTVSDALDEVAEEREKSRHARKAQREARNERASFRLVEIEGHIAAAIRRLRQAIQVAREVEFTEEELEVYEDAMGSLRTLVRLLDAKMTGESGTDWDAEFAAVVGGDRDAA